MRSLDWIQNMSAAIRPTEPKKKTDTNTKKNDSKFQTLPLTLTLITTASNPLSVWYMYSGSLYGGIIMLQDGVGHGYLKLLL
jgi:hypothetical protein